MGIKKKPTNEEKLTNIYYDPKTGYSGIDSIARKVALKDLKWLNGWHNRMYIHCINQYDTDLKKKSYSF